MSGLAAYLAANYGDGGEGVHVKAPAGAEVSSAEGVGERPKAKKLKKAPQDGARKRRKKIKGTKIAGALQRQRGRLLTQRSRQNLDSVAPPRASQRLHSGSSYFLVPACLPLGWASLRSEATYWHRRS